MVPLPEPGGGALVSYLRFLVFGRGRDKDIELEREREILVFRKAFRFS